MVINNEKIYSFRGDEPKTIYQYIFTVAQIILVFLIILIQTVNLKSLINIQLSDWSTKQDINFDDESKVWSIDEIKKNNEDCLIYGPYISLDEGNYVIEIEYACDYDQEFCLFVNDSSNMYVSNISNNELSKNSSKTKLEFQIYHKINNFEVQVKYNGFGDFTVKDIKIHKYISQNSKFKVMLGLLILDIIFVLIAHPLFAFKIMKANRKNRMIDNLFYLLQSVVLFICCILISSVIWGKNNFGSISMEEIVFTLNMPLAGTAKATLTSYYKDALIPSIVISLIYFIFNILPFSREYYVVVKNRDVDKQKRHLVLFPLATTKVGIVFILLISLLTTFFVADNNFELGDYIKNSFKSSIFIEQEYVDAKSVDIVFPEQKRNIIYIYVESAESSLQDVENGGLFYENYIPEMTQLAKNNISFSQSLEIQGAAIAPASGWTIAAIVAQSTGLPLKLYKYDKNNVDNSMDKYEKFMPGATALGDILQENGYKNYFLCGSDINFAGRKTFLKQHGNYTCYDYISAKEDGVIPSDYYVWWGMEDKKLYEYAKNKLIEIAKNDQPFSFTMLTVDTHADEGYLCELCDNNYSEQYANVWRCASRQLDSFINWIQQQDFYENTTIIVVGDHQSMTPTFFGEYSSDKYAGEANRKVFNVIINSAVDVSDNCEKNRLFTTLDFFPTTLASIGVKIEGERLGLGTNLFSEKPTLSEQYGYDYLFEELSRKSNYYNKFILY